MLKARCSMLIANALGIGAASFASKSGTSLGDGDEVTELVEVPKSNFGERDGNMASKDIAESPTAIAGTPRKRQQSTVNSQQALCTVLSLSKAMENE